MRRPEPALGAATSPIPMVMGSVSLGGTLEEVRRLLGGAYPEFVTARNSDWTDIGLPVFVFHTIEPGSFEAELRYLTDNGYRSLDADSFHAVLTGRRERSGREVLLTIDDGRSSAWVWAYPLLKRYGQRAVVFVIPGCVPDRASPLPRLDDDPAPATPLGDHDPELMSWEELRIAQQDAVFDVQSHTLFHRQVPASPEVVGFVTPTFRGPFYGVPLPLGLEAGSLTELQALAGLPVFRSEPLLSCSAVYAETPEVLQAPRALVQRSGGEAFFRRPGWRRRLMEEVRRARSAAGVEGRWLDASEIRRAAVNELADSRSEIQARLGGTVDHLCLPFSAGSSATAEIARDTGYKCVFWGARNDRTTNAVGDDPFHCVRLKHDYIWRLPGTGRKPLRAVVLRKMLRRLRGEAIY